MNRVQIPFCTRKEVTQLCVVAEILHRVFVSVTCMAERPNLQVPSVGDGPANLLGTGPFEARLALQRLLFSLTSLPSATYQSPWSRQ